MGPAGPDRPGPAIESTELNLVIRSTITSVATDVYKRNVPSASTGTIT
jgi:hypothetical protein